MKVRAASGHSGAASPGIFALVTYLPDPLGSFLTELRQMLPGDTFPQAHITFLPPRPLWLGVDMATRQVEQMLRNVRSFELELGSVQLFPQTNILYLDIKDGASSILELHACLNQGRLFAEECFEFIPHLTLGGPLVSDDAAAGIRRAVEMWEGSGLSRRFLVKEVVLLWQAGDCSDDWTRGSAHPLLSVVS